MSRKKKVVTLKKVLYAGPKYFDELTPEPSSTRTEKPGQTNVKSFILRVLLA